MKKTNKYWVGQGSIQPYNVKTIHAKGLRAAKNIYLNLYAYPMTKYRDLHGGISGKES